MNVYSISNQQTRTRTRIIRLLVVLFLPCLLFGSVSAQDFQTVPPPAGLGDLYDLNSFSVVDAVRGRTDRVSLDASYKGKNLVVRAKINLGWHLYSITQPKGGALRSEFQFELPEIELLEIRPTTIPHVDDKVVGFNVDIESHDDAVNWIFTFKDELPENTTVQGRLNGLVCKSGDNGVCVPIDIEFEAKYDPNLELGKYETDAKIPERFVFRPGKTDSDGDATESKSEFAPREISQVSGFGMMLLYAFLGGIILNVMPCVLPVIGLKILSFFEQAGKSRARAFYLNACYSLGLLSVFLVLAFLTVGLSRMFTYDLFSIVMACVVFAMALSLMDVWEISVPGFLGSGTAMKLTQQEGAVGAFCKGIITTLLAIPCGAPLLSPAVNWADAQIRSGDSLSVYITYGVIGLGMASPYLLIGAFPELLRFLPKPGDWMETFKKTMGFLLLVAVVWILYFIRPELVLPVVALLFAIWFACWMIGRLGYTAKPKARIVSWIVSLFVLLVVVFFAFDVPGVGNAYTLENAIKIRIYGHKDKHWQRYTPEKFDEAIRSGKPVLVDFTADWCVNCKVLEATVLHAEIVLKKLDEVDAVTLVADCTRPGPDKDFLLQFGADQVPVLALFDPKKPKEPAVIRGGYTQKTLLELLDQLE